MSVSEDSTLENSRRLIDKSTNGEIVVVPGHSNVQDATLVAGSASDRALDATLSPEPGQTRALSATLTVEPHVETGLANTLFADNVVPSSRGGFPVLEWERYEFLSLLGEGGMGSVYKARDKRLDRIVALKFIHSTDQAMIARFLQEARAQARLDNPFICKVYEVGEVQRQAYIAMQFVDGKSLENAATSMSLNEKVLIVQKVAEAIHAAHRIGIIHRDVKPANIMIERTADGSLNPILTDFGIAREAGEGQGLTETGMVMGTPAFMAPEQARGNTSAIDHRSDVYSLGATLYNLIASLPPFYANSVVDILLKVISEDATPLRTHVPSVPPDLETIVMKCLNKEPNHRYNSAKALAEDLGRYLDGDRILGQRLGFIARWQRRVRKHKTLFAVSALSAMIVLILAAGGVRQYLVNQREQHRLAEQARIEQELAQRLGQEITNLEWVLRSARQLPLHNLEREKVIVRERMAKLQADLASYGELSRGLASYALGRGHMALHEYPQALERLHQAMELGKQTPDVHYALGVVLGKQFEQAMYEARLAGGGDWAKKQREELEPKYLAPAIASLQRSRAADLDSPMYLEGLIAYYGRDYEGSLRYAAKALESAPWLYEAHKLMGDIHLERALQARDSGKYKEAETEFAGALKSYEAAAAIGQSDGEVYEGLAECWVRQIQMAVYQGQPAETAYAAAIAASDKITIAEPQSIAGLLKKAYAANMAMAVSGVGLTAAERVRQCLVAAEGVLEKQPGHPYASDVAANCNVLAADAASASHQDPKPFLRKALSLLEPTVKQYPHFLWGLNDLGYATIFFGLHLQLHGDRTAKETLQKSLEYFSAATALDATYVTPYSNVLGNMAYLVPEVRTEEELKSMLSHADDWLTKCTTINRQFQQCFNNYFQVYARAASRDLLAGRDPQPRLNRALENLKETSKLGGSLQDAEQHAALIHLVAATDRMRNKRDPDVDLLALQADLGRCFAFAPQDARCRTLAAQGEWVRADWLASQKMPIIKALEEALARAVLATQSPETYPDAWQTLAATHLRLAREKQNGHQRWEPHVAAAQSALDMLFTINPNHALGLGTQGALLLFQAQVERDSTIRKTRLQSAEKALDRAIDGDPFLTHDYALLRDTVRALAEVKD